MRREREGRGTGGRRGGEREEDGGHLRVGGRLVSLDVGSDEDAVTAADGEEPLG
jgi:hypothetical protein